MRFRDILYTLAVLICGAAVSSAQFRINPYAFAAGGGGGTSWITNASPLSTTSNNWEGWIGCKFTMNETKTVTHLRRWVIAGSSQSHEIKVFTEGGTELGVATVNAASYSGEWAVVAVGSPFVLSSGTTYRIGSREYSGGDPWHEPGGLSYTVTSAATGIGAAYGAGAYPNTDGTPAANATYGPLSFDY